MRIDDLSHRGDLKPSGERGVHAAIYRARPDVRFVVHTHQAAASAISATPLGEIRVAEPLLGGTVLIADYGLPSTKKLRENVAEALTRTEGHAIIMRNHGAVCFGADPDEVFDSALQLERACAAFIRELHRRDTRMPQTQDETMREDALTALAQPSAGRAVQLTGPACASERTPNGFVLHPAEGDDRAVHLGEIDASLPPEAAVHAAIYARHPRIRSIVPAADADTVTLSRAHIVVRPLLDDFAQIVGTSVQTVSGAPDETADALKKADAVMIAGRGALCCGATREDAEAVRMIVAKNSTAYLWSALAGGVEQLPRLDAHLMRFVYRRKYSKEISRNVA